MNNESLIRHASEEIESFRGRSRRARTGDVRRVSAKVYGKLKGLSLVEKLEVCEALLDRREWALGVIAYDIAYRERKRYTPDLFERFERWLADYVRDWGDCDDFCTHAFGSLLAEYGELIPRVLSWCGRPEFWMRRAAPVVLIYPIRKGALGGFDPFSVSDALIADEHDLVRKGYGWMLKVYSQYEEERLVRYLQEKVGNMPRVAFRYALEKLDGDSRRKLMGL